MRWGGIFDVDNKKIQVEEEELRTHVPDFWSDQKKAEQQMRKIKTLKMWIEKCAEVEDAVGEVEVGFDFVKEGVLTEDELNKERESRPDPRWAALDDIELE